MKELSASQAAVLADSVYALTEMDSLKQAIAYLNRELGELFDFSMNNLLAGRTGGVGDIKCRTAFGFILIGKNSFKGHAVMLFRGTDYMADWLTNLNFMLSRSAGSHPVHDGFNKTFKSMKPKIQQYLPGLTAAGIHTVHCIGHSLGGALAMLCGEWLASMGKAPYVYTFGAPRVGLSAFAESCTRRLRPQRIYRAYHRTDIVTLIPTWPFVHAPSPGIDYFLPSPGLIPGAEYHGMPKYIRSVQGKPWSTLVVGVQERKSAHSIAAWLKGSIPVTNGVVGLQWINEALIFVLKKCLQGADWLVSQMSSTSLTLADRLAYILQRGARLAEDISAWVLHLIRKILSFLGFRSLLEPLSLTHSLIKRALLQLQMRMNRMAQQALNQLLVKGRGL